MLLTFTDPLLEIVGVARGLPLLLGSETLIDELAEPGCRI